jgi:non-ribosomal peptide synthetase component F
MGSIEHPAEYVEQVGVVNRNDLDTILKWNSNSPEEVSRCLHDLFQEQATHRADALAICSWDGEYDPLLLNKYHGYILTNVLRTQAT